ncbi:prolipoprotein diacylglyceryl transferase [Qingshengfaniella alkalisoli]|uniref:Phosphatidylglycerol--prolipoprotein diacylglyceryl transferase n=1 Tax=Qingshengfaniella alkalisoli TaxID=2599296 RepID=A0A5B8IVD8_9RHOB|nr:prolipoprotein diacylglyceryl transferase [Qingshengfaniella alkalisoli]QDY68458.1 prolipoprotein diacylglyceryl transferase [Qingshengfaniella alkalisoli]
MLMAIPFPDISPEIFAIDIGGFYFALRWYALAYILGLLIGLWILRRVFSSPKLWPGNQSPMTPEQAEMMLTWIIVGVIIGGRLGFVLMYQPAYYLSHPMEILKVWQGGMAFHGGFLGVIIACTAFCWKQKIPMLPTADALALATPPGLLLGRLANFINAELWGRPSSVPWAVIFPGEHAQACPTDWVGPCARHPSQLYEAGLEGLLLGAILLCLAFATRALKAPGLIAGLFFLGYGLSRMFVELFRQADAQFITTDNPMGYVVRAGEFGLSMGQLLSLPMVVLGIIMIAVATKHSRT